ncbi:MAG: CsgG/HfaB family protein, partial [Rhodospirillales bacterium]
MIQKCYAQAAAAIFILSLGGCASIGLSQMAPDEAPVVTGPAVRSNRTPLEGAFVCLTDDIRRTNRPRLAIAVGDVKDYTGKYSQDEGSTITQGGALMVYSALGKLGNTVQLHERFDTRIAELELAYTDRRQLGDGKGHIINGKQVVPWVPYFGGSILRTNYYIVGGITELNYNIQSAGAEGYVNLIGPKARVFTLNVGVDLRIIDTQTLVVVKTISLEKQIVGYEVGFNLFRFFGSNLFDINIGTKSQEPLQLGVRTALEQGTLDLVAAVYGLNAKPCVDAAIKSGTNGKASEAANSPPPPPPAPVASAPAPAAGPVVVAGDKQSAMVPENADGGAGGRLLQVPFEFGSTALDADAASAIEKIAAAAAKGNPVSVQIIGRDSETWSPQKRQDIAAQRIRAFADALTARGVQPSRIRVQWRPDTSDQGIRRDGAGYQVFAIILIT